jgi:hypothetical protein
VAMQTENFDQLPLLALSDRSPLRFRERLHRSPD